MDGVDLKILGALQREGRITNQRLSDVVGLSASACLARVKRLERAGVITGYRAQVDPTKLGACLVVFAEITVSSHDAASLRHIEAFLRDLPQAIEAYQVGGSYDLLVRFLVGGMSEWSSVADSILKGDLGVVTIRMHSAIRILKSYSGVPVARALHGT